MKSEIQRIHLIAICGTGMGALACLLKEKGYNVRGSDERVYPPMSQLLERMGIPVRLGFSQKNLDPRPDLVVVGNAVSRKNPEVETLLSNGIPYLSMPQALAEFFLKDRTPIVVTGTHGKTTTTALTAWLLEKTGRSPGFLIGGVLRNTGQSSQVGKGKHFVVEGDEYDSAFFDKKAKFLYYRPKILILNPIEFDHADIYPDFTQMMRPFQELVSSLGKEALVIASHKNTAVQHLRQLTSSRWITFGLEEGADIRGVVTREDRGIHFRLLVNEKDLGEISTPLIGRHNVENLLAAVAIFRELGGGVKEVSPTLRDFQGIKRRQEVIGEVKEITIVDDFAHHPTAIHETLTALKRRYPTARLWAIFEPRSNTIRRKIFQKELPGAFQSADEILLGPLYLPEKIPPEDRLDLNQVVEDLRGLKKKVRQLPIDAIADTVVREAQSGDILCLMSSGDFGGLRERILVGLQGDA